MKILSRKKVIYELIEIEENGNINSYLCDLNPDFTPICDTEANTWYFEGENGFEKIEDSSELDDLLKDYLDKSD